MIATEPHGGVEGGHLMATWESEKRMERRRTQRYWEQFNADPEIIALAATSPRVSGTKHATHTLACQAWYA